MNAAVLLGTLETSSSPTPMRIVTSTRVAPPSGAEVVSVLLSPGSPPSTFCDSVSGTLTHPAENTVAPSTATVRNDDQESSCSSRRHLPAG